MTWLINCILYNEMTDSSSVEIFLSMRDTHFFHDKIIGTRRQHLIWIINKNVTMIQNRYRRLAQIMILPVI